MRIGRWVLGVGFIFAASGCFTRIIAEKMGISGWCAIDLEQADAGYRSRFSSLGPTQEPLRCEEIAKHLSPGRPVVVLVHGVGGDGPETEESVARFAAAPTVSLFMFRWVPYENRDAISQRLAEGVSRIVECNPDQAGRIVVLAHSAGGVLSSQAASKMRGPAGVTGPWVTVLTAASPLAGTVRRTGNPEGREESTFMLDLGTRITTYPAAAEGVRVIHLRSQYPADNIMVPSGDLLPNDPKIGVPGAPQLDLPDHLDHAGAMVYVAGRVADGTWVEWLAPPK